jgi:aminopeptidase N
MFAHRPELNGWFWDEYNITVPMPTYLVAIIISDYDFSEASPDLYNKPVRVRKRFCDI